MQDYAISLRAKYEVGVFSSGNELKLETAQSNTDAYELFYSKPFEAKGMETMNLIMEIVRQIFAASRFNK